MLIGFETIIDYIKKNKLQNTNCDVYEFGVCTGGGTGQILTDFRDNEISFNKFYGFDSWEGLPEEAEGIYRPDIWEKGAFTAHHALHIAQDKVIPHLIAYTSRLTDRPVEFISGFYEKSLTPELAKEKKFRPALFVSMDVDIYISCLQVWEYMIAQKLIIPGTVIRYDDWGDFTHPMWEGRPEGTFGESLAHYQVIEKYGIEFEDLYLEHGVKVVAVK